MARAVTFEPQQGAAAERTCGAAVLAMVYRALSAPVPQEAIWRAVASRSRDGSSYARTHRMVLDAQLRGFAAVAMRARAPREALAHFERLDEFVVLNHRLRGSRLGHFTVLHRVLPDRLVLQDPQLGPWYTEALEHFLESWMPTSPPSEVTGHVAIVVGRQSLEPLECAECGRPSSRHVRCPMCRHSVSTGPAGALGCMSEHCARRIWAQLICPACDAELTLSGHEPAR